MRRVFREPVGDRRFEEGDPDANFQAIALETTGRDGDQLRALTAYGDCHGLAGEIHHEDTPLAPRFEREPSHQI